MRVALTVAAREHLREFARDRSFRSPEAAVEVAIWGLDGPAVELVDAERQASFRASLEVDSGPFYSGRVVATRIRAHMAEHERVLEAWTKHGEPPLAIHLGEDAGCHVRAFVRGGVYASPEAAVEAALAAAVSLSPTGTLDPSPTDW